MREKDKTVRQIDRRGSIEDVSHLASLRKVLSPPLAPEEQDFSGSRTQADAGNTQPKGGPLAKPLHRWMAIFLCGISVPCLLALAMSVSYGFLLAIPVFASIAIGIIVMADYHQQRVMQLNESNAAISARLETLEDQTWELRESEERYRSLSETFGDLVMHRTTDGEITLANAAFAEVFGKSIEQIIGTKFNQCDLLASGNSNGAETPGMVHEICLDTPNGTRWYSWLDIPIRDDIAGKATIRSVARDVTEHKLTEIALREASEKALSASSAKSRFLANVSHEMRTPLNGILGMSDLLSDTTLSPDQVTYNKAIHSSGAALLTLVEDILDIARIEANHFNLRSEPFAINQLIENITELISVKAHAKGIGLSSYFSGKIPVVIKGDEGRLRQVIINLLGNAVKFTNCGEVSLRVEKVGATENGDKVRLRFEVEDTGPGMSISDQKRIFGEFVQIEDNNTRQHGGAGLGLAISQAIVQQMGGQIKIESRLGKGSLFHFEVEFPVGEEIKTPKDNDGVPTRKLDGRKILILSKAKLESDALALATGDDGGSAECINQLKGAYALLRDNLDSGAPFDHVLIDSNISRDPGISLAKLRRLQTEPLHATILLTPDERKRLPDYLAAGFDAFLIRPVRTSSLLNVLSGGIQNIADSEAHKMNDKAADVQSSSGRKLNVLLAEDNDINALLARSVLEKAGHHVHRSENGRLAAAEFRRCVKEGNPYDLVLMDLHMPVMDGLDAVTSIRKFEKSKKLDAVRIYILTADEQKETRAEASSAGADGYLTKPFVPARLIELARDVAE